MKEVYEVCARLKTAGFPQTEGMAAVCYNPEVSPLDYTDGEPYWLETPFELGMHKGINGNVYRFLTGTSILACPNVSECMKEARARGWHMKVNCWGIAGVWLSGDGEELETALGWATVKNDPDQAARLALAAALEAQKEQHEQG